MRLLAFAVALIAALANPVSAEDMPGAAASASVSGLVDDYVAVALGAPGNPSGSTLLKWQAPSVNMVVLPMDSFVDAGLPLVISTIDRINAYVDDIAFPSDTFSITTLSGQDTIGVLSGADGSRISSVVANGIVILVGNKSELLHYTDVLSVMSPDMPAAAQAVAAGTEGKPFCFAYLDTSVADPSTLIRGDIFVERSDDLPACVHEKLLRVLGLPNDLPAGAPSILNAANTSATPTELDRILLRIHLDPRLEPGMPEPDVRQAATAIVSDILGAGIGN